MTNLVFDYDIEDIDEEMDDSDYEHDLMIRNALREADITGRSFDHIMGEMLAGIYY